jgi:hypothetical protein
MPLVVEDGTGVAGADSYAALTAIDAYWAARPNNPLSAVWAAEEDEENKNGAAREATAYLDATWGAYYRGARKDYVQGREWPRVGPTICGQVQPLTDINGVTLPDLPPQLIAAEAELSARALTAPLATDIDAGARVKSKTEKVGPIEETTDYFDAGETAPKTSYGIVHDLLSPILNGAQPGSPAANWSWA